MLPNLVARIDGPLHFRFIAQPLMAAIFAVIDGVKDAKIGKPAYFWAMLVSPGRRKELIRDGWKSVCKMFVVAMLLEALYQVKVHQLNNFGYVLIAPFLLAILPYLLLRGPTNRFVRLLRKKS
jgi:hypothetical protein